VGKMTTYELNSKEFGKLETELEKALPNSICVCIETLYLFPTGVAFICLSDNISVIFGEILSSLLQGYIGGIHCSQYSLMIQIVQG
jgi:hypothetical protein